MQNSEFLQHYGIRPFRNIARRLRRRPTGSCKVQLEGAKLPTGIYIARLVTPEYTKSIKMVLLK